MYIGTYLYFHNHTIYRRGTTSVHRKHPTPKRIIVGPGRVPNTWLKIIPPLEIRAPKKPLKSI